MSNRVKSWTQDHKSTSQAPQPLSHNVSNNAGKIHVNVTFTIIFHIYFKIQGEVKWRLKENYKDHSQTILETISQLGLNWANWALGLKNLSFKMRPSMCQKSHDACTTFHYNYLFSLLSSSPNLTFIVKKNGIHLSFSTLMLLYLITGRSHYHNI